MKNKCVPGGDAIIVRSGTAALAVKKALRSDSSIKMSLEGASIDLNMDILGQNEGNEMEQATNYTSSKVSFYLSHFLLYLFVYYWL